MKGAAFSRNEPLQLACQGVGLKTDLEPAVEGPGLAISERQQILVDDEGERPFGPAVGDVDGCGHEVGVAQVVVVVHDLDVHVLFGGVSEYSSSGLRRPCSPAARTGGPASRPAPRCR